MKNIKYTIKSKVPWWFKHYINALAFFCAITGRKPDIEKFEKLFLRVVKVKAERLNTKPTVDNFKA